MFFVFRHVLTLSEQVVILCVSPRFQPGFQHVIDIYKAITAHLLHCYARWILLETRSISVAAHFPLLCFRVGRKGKQLHDPHIQRFVPDHSHRSRRGLHALDSLEFHQSQSSSVAFPRSVVCCHWFDARRKLRSFKVFRIPPRVSDSYLLQQLNFSR